MLASTILAATLPVSIGSVTASPHVRKRRVLEVLGK